MIFPPSILQTHFLLRIGEDGEFLSSPLGRKVICDRPPDHVGDVIKKELEFVQNESAMRIQKLSHATDIHIGNRKIFSSFCQD